MWLAERACCIQQRPLETCNRVIRSATRAHTFLLRENIERSLLPHDRDHENQKKRLQNRFGQARSKPPTGAG
ncbi:MAG: hypothetical protein DME65_10230 [Verrucomicrobia bacterium]|nr:MAG: hypothetical protein DME65_10230 [Verrucomicrobiota bacterium]